MDPRTGVAYSILQTTVLSPTLKPTSDYDWIETWETIVYYALPILLGLALVLGVFNIIVLSNQMTVSVDSYLIGLSLASTLLVTCAVLTKMPAYIQSPDSDVIFTRMYPIVVGLYDWFKYTVVWVIIVMALERCMNVRHQRIKPLCSKLQALMTMGMVYLICLVSSLPQFWANQVIEVVNRRTNQTKILVEKTESALSPEYNIYYWYTHVLYVILAYPMLIVLFCILVWHSRRAASKKYSLKHGTGVVLSRKVSQEMSITRLQVALIATYLLLTGPLTIYQLLPRIPVAMSLPEKTLNGALVSIFECTFYLFFILKFFLLIIFDGKFRFTLRSICCCCCPRKE